MKTLNNLPDHCHWWGFANPDALASALAASVAQSLCSALQHRERASLALSGGNTPARFVCALAGYELDWSRVDLCLCDERWVPLEHEESNQGALHKRIADRPMAAANLRSLYMAADSPEAALEDLEQRFEDFAWPLDVCVLGMGDDGHTASLFPGMPNLDVALDPRGPQFVAVPSGYKGAARVSLCARDILSAHRRVVHIEGESKLKTLQQVCETREQDEHPIWGLIANAPCEIVWATS